MCVRPSPPDTYLTETGQGNPAIGQVRKGLEPHLVIVALHFCPMCILQKWGKRRRGGQVGVSERGSLFDERDQGVDQLAPCGAVIARNVHAADVVPAGHHTGFLWAHKFDHGDNFSGQSERLGCLCKEMHGAKVRLWYADNLVTGVIQQDQLPCPQGEFLRCRLTNDLLIATFNITERTTCKRNNFNHELLLCNEEGQDQA